MAALTPLQLEVRDGAQQPLDVLIRHCFRLSQYSATQRLADLLLDIQRRLHAANCISGTSYLLPLAQHQLGELLGMSAVHVNRSLQALRPMIRFEKHHIHIDQPEKFAAMCRRD